MLSVCYFVNFIFLQTECARCHAGTRQRRRSDRHGVTIIVITRSGVRRLHDLGLRIIMIIRLNFIISTEDPTHPSNRPQINDSGFSLL